MAATQESKPSDFGDWVRQSLRNSPGIANNNGSNPTRPPIEQVQPPTQPKNFQQSRNREGRGAHSGPRNNTGGPNENRQNRPCSQGQNSQISASHKQRFPQRQNQYLPQQQNQNQYQGQNNQQQPRQAVPQAPKVMQRNDHHHHHPQPPMQTSQGNRQSSGPPPRSKPSGFKPISRPHQPTPHEYNLQCSYLEETAVQQLQGAEMSAEEFDTKDYFRRHLEHLCRQAMRNFYEPGKRLSLVSFGSMSSGFGMPGSDMDLALVTPTLTAETPRLLERALLDQGYGARLLTRTRVPVLKVCERPTPELYQALCDERQKWDDMTSEERERHDRPGPREPRNDANKNAEGPSANIGESQGATGEDDAKTAKETQATARDTPSDPSQVSSATNASHLSPDNNTLEASRNGKPESNGIKQSTAESNQKGEHSPADSSKNNAKPRVERPWYRERYLGPLDFPKTGVGIQCDINSNNPLGIHNTLLLRCYSRCDYRVRLMILFVKRWASQRKINSSYNGTLSSYGYVLMVLHFLINVAKPFVCPNLQLCAKYINYDPYNIAWPTEKPGPDPSHPDEFCEGYDVRFWRNEREITHQCARRQMTQNQQPLGSLLRDFYHYYACQGPNVVNGGFSWTQDVLSLRTQGGTLSKQEKEWTGAKTILVDEREVRQRYLFAIEDPFELEHNVARTVTHHGICAIRDEFRRAWRLIGDRGMGKPFGSEDDLFEEVISVKPPSEQGEADKKAQEVEAKAEVRNGQASESIPEANAEGSNASVPAVEKNKEAVAPGKESHEQASEDMTGADAEAAATAEAVAALALDE
ncbi:MAG: hypothetical protein M1831_005570 [Alyxoria varia]|nr:MAG: hypothetical protein M1831_005570 [Alyxoria varia]